MMLAHRPLGDRPTPLGRYVLLMVGLMCACVLVVAAALGTVAVLDEWRAYRALQQEHRAIVAWLQQQARTQPQPPVPQPQHP